MVFALRTIRTVSSMKRCLRLYHRRYYSSKPIVLGIETSCDDTGCAVVNGEGMVLGQSLHSQQHIHINNGGIIPPIARDLHEQNIARAVEEALAAATTRLQDLDAIAVTNRPGLPLSLLVGLSYAKQLARTTGKPLVPVHHMAAHALTVRMTQKVPFPFLVLLVSGGHCLLAVARAADDFLLLGSSLDDAPGEALDKTARRLKLHNLPAYARVSGGRAIQLAARDGDPLAFPFPMALSGYRDCNFSLAGLKNTARRIILSEEQKYGIEADGVIPSVGDVCAGMQLAIARHLCQRTQSAMEFVGLEDLLPADELHLVVSGGVACNEDILLHLTSLATSRGYTTHVPPPALCTDNGAMIAWTAVELLRANRGSVADIDAVDIHPKCPLGEDWSQRVVDANIKCRWFKLNSQREQEVQQG